MRRSKVVDHSWAPWKEENIEFQEFLFPAERTRSLVGLSVGFLIYPAFSFLDVVTYPNQLNLLLSIRALALTFLAVSGIFVFRARTYGAVVRATAVGYVVPASGIAVMCHLTEGVVSPYYAGIPLSTVFLAAFLTWPVSLTSAAFAVVLGSYFLPMIRGVESLDWRSLALNSSFLLGTMALVILGMRLRLLLAWNLYSNRRELAQRNQELAELHELKDRMFQNVSHELRTPLTLMLTPLQQRLKTESDDNGDTSWIRQMYRNGMRLLKQINDLLDLARLDAEGFSVDRQTVDVGSLVHELVEDLHAMTDVSGLDIELSPSDGKFLYNLDPAHLERVLLNLLSNAVRFTSPGGKITVGLSEDGEELKISVTDTGPGIPRLEHKRIFDRFQQLHAGDGQRYGGSGIGLALVDELVQLLGGTIQVDSRRGRGSTFTVAFPAELKVRATGDEIREARLSGEAAIHRQAELETIGSRASRAKRVTAGTRGPSILVVEDDDRMRHQLVHLLSSDHRVVGVAGGEAALREALLIRPHVVISDVMMPGMDGVELCRRLRERAELRDTAVILLTAKGKLEDRIEGRRVGADSYLTKPFDVRELLATIEGLLRSRMRLVGEYLVRRRLGRGGQSEVWRAEHRVSGEPVALKIIRPSGIEDEKARERLRREHEALVQLEHLNIVNIVARGEQAGGFFLAMEYLDGTSLDSLIADRAVLPFGVIASIGASAASALAHVHECGLIHRDVKCSNIMLLSGSGDLRSRIRLIDFGTATQARRESPGRGRIIGSLPYIAPELLERIAEPSPATDIYGLGVVLFRLSTGSFPFSGRSERSILAATRIGPDPKLEAAARDMPDEMRAAIERAISHRPERRWRDARSLEDALASFADDQGKLSISSVSASTSTTATMSVPETAWTATTAGA